MEGSIVALIGAADLHATSTEESHSGKVGNLASRLAAHANQMGWTSHTFVGGDFADGNAPELTNAYDHLSHWGQADQTRVVFPAVGNHDRQDAHALDKYREPNELFRLFAGKAEMGETFDRYVSPLGGPWVLVVLDSSYYDSSVYHKPNYEELYAIQLEWLRKQTEQLAAEKKHIIAMWHHPVLLPDSQKNGLEKARAPFIEQMWRLLAPSASVVLTGHIHHYARFAPMTADLEKAENGDGPIWIQVGTGGAGLHPLECWETLVHRRHSHGVVRLKLSCDPDEATQETNLAEFFELGATDFGIGKGSDCVKFRGRGG